MSDTVQEYARKDFVDGNYAPLNKQFRELLSPYINTGRIDIFERNGKTYVNLSQVQEILSDDVSPKFKYSVMELKDYNKERHISIENAYKLIEDQNDPYLSTEKLEQAVDNNEIRLYEFEGKKYLDRFDIGRVYYQPKLDKKGLTIERYFSKEREDPFESVGEYEKRYVQIKDMEGNVIFEMDDAYFPKSWSENSSRIVSQKYFFRPKEDEWKEKLREKIGKDYEFSPINLINRVTNFIADEGFKLGYFATERDKEVFADELNWLQINQRFAFNSPVQFNAGLFNEYGIEGSRGFSYWRNPETGEIVKVEEGEHIHPQCHACFIKGPQDDLESILDHVKDEGAIFSLGSGVGQDIGALRGKGEPLSGGGKASGPMSFFKIYDDAAGTIKSGGKSRRAARMTTMRYMHRDIMDFIRAKPNEDRKALILMQAGYEGGMDGEAYTTVTFQNTNLSVRLDDFFFGQLEKGGDIDLVNVKDGKIVGKFSADRVLKEIAYGSWRIGDPGMQYESEIQKMHTAKNSGRINSSNPCSEYMFLNDTSCNLNSHNLLAYSDENGKFNVEEFEIGTRLSSIAADILNDAASYPVKSIATISPEFRTIGIGYANLGSLLMRRGVAYDSEEGRALAGAITALMTGTSYETSIELAEKLGSFIHFEFNKKPMIEVMERHRANLEKIVWDIIPEEDLKQAAYDSWNNVVNRGREVGFRNAQATVLAPTGTISYLLDSYNSNGVEPSISLKIIKNLAGGGNLVIINEEVPNALKNLGYNEQQIKEIQDFIDKKAVVIGAPHMSPDHYKIFATSLGNGRGEGAISFEGHVRILGAVQPFISGAISKTCNMPESASVKDFYDGFILGNKLNLKALSAFRDNGKPTSALSFGARGFRKLERGEKEDLPAIREAYEIEFGIGGTPFHILVSEYENGKPGQITFLSYKSGSSLGALLTTSGIQASRSLKRGVSLEDVVDGWLGHEFEPRGFVSGDPYIKTASSPLDFAAKLLLLEYLGRTEFAQEPDKVDIKGLRGFKNGAFRTYERERVDDWDIEQVLNDPEYGGFVEKKENKSKKGSATRKSPDENKNNSKGVVCRVCGHIMVQTAPNCYECGNCAEKTGGCGL